MGRVGHEKPSLFGVSLKLPEPWEKCPLFSCPFSALGGSSALHIPAFPGGGCLIDYVPQVCHLLTNKVKASPLPPPPCEAPSSSVIYPASWCTHHPLHPILLVSASVWHQPFLLWITSHPFLSWFLCPHSFSEDSDLLFQSYLHLLNVYLLFLEFPLCPKFLLDLTPPYSLKILNFPFPIICCMHVCVCVCACCH